jgi:hypothetical protein
MREQLTDSRDSVMTKANGSGLLQPSGSLVQQSAPAVMGPRFRADDIQRVLAWLQ